MIVEADSELIVNSVKRISWGTTPNKTSKNWRLIQIFQRIQLHLQILRIVSFNHMRRTTNKLADIMANQGVICTENMGTMGWQELPHNRLKANCHDQADEDNMVFQNRAMEARPR